jgi:hypothetical protein
MRDVRRGRLEVAVQGKRVEVGAVGPNDRSEIIVHPNLRKEVGVGKRLEYGTVQLSAGFSQSAPDLARIVVARNALR